MGRPRKSDVYKANATALGDLAKPLREAARTLRGSAERGYTTIDNFDWLGDTREAAVGRAERDMTANRVKADHLDELADAYENGSKTMQPMIEGLKSKGQGLEGNTFEISKDWKVTDNYDYAAARRLATMMDPGGAAGLQAEVDKLQARRANEAATETGNLQRLADELGMADTNTDTAIGKALAALGQAPAPMPAGKPSAQQATFQQDKPTTPGGPTPSGVDPATVDPKVLGLLPGVDPRATQPGTPSGSLPDLLDKALHPKTAPDPNAGRLIDSLARIDPSTLAKRTWVEKIPGIPMNPNTPEGKAALDGMRNIYKAQGVPADQIESRIQQDIKNAAQDRYVVHNYDPDNVNKAPPAEGLHRSFGDKLADLATDRPQKAFYGAAEQMLQEGKNLVGQGGPGQPGAAEAWKDLGVGTAKGLYEQMTNPLGGAVDQAKDFYHDPADFTGKKLFEAATIAPTLPFGGEGAALTDARALAGHGLEDATHIPPSTIEHHTPTGGDHGPVGGDHSTVGGDHTPVHDGGDFGTDGAHHPYGGDAGAIEPRPYNDNIEAYPRAYHPGTGEEMPFPPGDLDRVPNAERSDWTKMDRYYFIKQWHDMGYAEPPGGWEMYDIHHIRPREFGGDNSFENLIPVPRPVHNQRITPWWNNYGQG